MAYVSHLDLQRIFQRTLRRAGIAARESEGFNPHIKLHFSPSLPLFVTSDCEFVEFEAALPDMMKAAADLDAALPEGLSLNSLQPAGFGKLAELLCWAEYEISLVAAGQPMAKTLAAEYESAPLLSHTVKRGREKTKNLREGASWAEFSVQAERVIVRCQLSMRAENLISPLAFSRALIEGMPSLNGAAIAYVHKTAVLDANSSKIK